MNRSVDESGVKVASVESIGFAGAWAIPLFVMNAKFTYSSPAFARQAALFVWPVTGFSERLSMFSAAHQCVASHELAPTATAHVGQGTQPGG